MQTKHAVIQPLTAGRIGTMGCVSNVPTLRLSLREGSMIGLIPNEKCGRQAKQHYAPPFPVRHTGRRLCPVRIYIGPSLPSDGRSKLESRPT